MNRGSLIPYFVIAMLVTAVLTYFLIPYFHRKQFGQYIREEGPQAHKSKAGTPTMGGIAIVAGIIVGVILAFGRNPDGMVIILTMVGFGLIGFLDDFEKIAKKNNLGLNPRQKIILQLVFGAAIAFYMMFAGQVGTSVFIPFAKVWVDLGYLFIPFVIFVEIAMSNAVNLTDGLDGLASSVTIIVGIGMTAIGLSAGNGVLASSGMIIAGALAGFLIFNRHPAKIFMGDTGSMALGGVLSAVTIVTGTEFILPVLGLIYVLEALSVIIQVTYFRKTGGKRFFRMAPLHHHFELGGMNEVRVVLLFSTFTALCCVIGYYSVI
ncbi:phospho-N-acetylmuramoyl-pentapeptide-transferase [Mobilibacterium timonense]|uniref:phospho-N-acetylmuramoyl-pentapeptide- transferase n=1 Tax=Mobilibacterium timonense TaxID=1871012 RepID=UPI0009872A3A|nr:phospho-N-acetylmuramoyl-pentapeptide-transferase [Mobilibacterium timonense]MBM6990751.1 phospho-N-acetylmuramoyl-pentapeptide-transferase [Mobilibacterium timonense]